MKFGALHVILTLLVGIVIGMVITKKRAEGFTDVAAGCKPKPVCSTCSNTWPNCNCSKPQLTCTPCKEPDMSKYVLKATIPPCTVCPDLTDYIKKTEIPPVPDLSKYVLRSSIPKQQPVILDCSKCQKPSGECPPCPRPRCPEVKCPPPTKCPGCAPCPRQTCPSTVVKCKAEDPAVDTVRPYLAPLNWNSFGN
jgi:hypothetical protein